MNPHLMRMSHDVETSRQEPFWQLCDVKEEGDAADPVHYENPVSEKKIAYSMPKTLFFPTISLLTWAA